MAAKSTTYVALLRGINVGGNHKVPMARLKAILESLGFVQVKTLLNSGNVAFTAPLTSPESLRKKIERELQSSFGFPVPTIVRTRAELQELVTSDPFKGIPVTKETRLYVTFLSEQPTKKLKLPHFSPAKNFRIIELTKGEILSVLVLMPKFGTTAGMDMLEKEFGKNLTTRNWNTVVKLANL